MENEKFQELVLAKLGQLDGNLSEIQSSQQRTEVKVVALESSVGSLGVLMEKVSKDVKAVVEGLSAHREQNERQFNELKEFIKEENILLKSVLKHSNSELWELKRVGGNG